MSKIRERRNPNKFYKIIKASTNAKTERWAVTVPPVYAERFQDVFFKISITDDAIIYRSGAKHATERNNYEEIDGHKKTEERGAAWWAQI